VPDQVGDKGRIFDRHTAYGLNIRVVMTIGKNDENTGFRWQLMT
jgi:hypothetical protein